MNQTTLIGTLKNGKIDTLRTSDISDSIPVHTNESGYVHITGSLHTYNTPDHHLRLYVQPTTIEPTEEESYNEISLSGYICKTPIYRTTPAGRKITDILIAVNRDNMGSDYIPCIAWGKNAVKAAEYKIGDYVQIRGRIQSREYYKNEEIKTVYEVSIDKFKD